MDRGRGEKLLPTKLPLEKIIKNYYTIQYGKDLPQKHDFLCFEPFDCIVSVRLLGCPD
jgi:hypothetical protein